MSTRMLMSSNSNCEFSRSHSPTDSAWNSFVWIWGQCKPLRSSCLTDFGCQILVCRLYLWKHSTSCCPLKASEIIIFSYRSTVGSLLPPTLWIYCQYYHHIVSVMSLFLTFFVFSSSSLPVWTADGRRIRLSIYHTLFFSFSYELI
jgi:hypothetical protein